jgi:hypothetical protein
MVLQGKIIILSFCLFHTGCFVFLPFIMSSPNLLAAGKAQAAQANITKFSQLIKASPRNAAEHASYFSRRTLATTKAMYRFDKDFSTVFIGVAPNAKFIPLVLPRLTQSDSATPTFVVGLSLNDEMDRIQPSTLDPSHFEESVVTCVLQGDVDAHFLPHVLLNVADPVDIPPVRPDGATEDPAAGFGRLNWIDTNSDPKRLPVFAAIPKVCPVQHGTTFPFGHSVLDLIPADVDLSPLCRMWAEGMRYLFLYNNGISVHAPASTFFQGDAVRANDEANGDHFRGVTLSNAATIQPESALPFSSVADATYLRAEGIRDAFYLSIAPETPCQDGYQTPGTHTAPDTLTNLADAIKNCNRATPSRRDTEEANNVRTRSAFYSLLFAEHQEANPATGEPAKIILAMLNKEFVTKVL